MNACGTCVIRFAGVQVAVDWRGRCAEALLRFLYGPQQFGPLEPCPAPLQVRSAADDSRVVVSRHTEVLYAGACPGEAADALIEWTMHDLINPSDHGLVLHAAALAWHGCGIVLPGNSGAGKSTLSAWLTSEGYTYLSDELVCLEPERLVLQSFYRPLHLRPSALTVLAKRLHGAPAATDDAGKYAYKTTRGVFLPITRLRPDNVYETPSVRLLLFPTYRPQAALHCVRLSPAQAGLYLMRCLVNARNLPDHGLPAVTHCVQHMPAYQLTYSDLNAVVAQLSAILHGLP